ncbi:MAG: hypothetical protein K8I02_08490 [Candidatus Methylomirabilis sp.]|nr:hypothetical protein [Deltaproteobacteria bacterium]
MTLRARLDAMKAEPAFEREGDVFPRFDPLALLQHLGRVEGVVFWTHASGVSQTLEAPAPLHIEVMPPRDDSYRYQLARPDGSWLPGHGHIRFAAIEKIEVEIHPDNCMPAAYVVTLHGLRRPAHLLTVGLPVWYDPNRKDRAALNEDALAIYRFLRERLAPGVVRVGGAWRSAAADLHPLALERYERSFRGA